MQTIQQKLADRIYELLPEKKELKFGCEVEILAGIDEWVDFETGKVMYECGMCTKHKKQSSCSEDCNIEDAFGLLIGDEERGYFIMTIAKSATYKIIGSPIRLADVFRALYKTYGSIFYWDDYGDTCVCVNGEKVIEDYNLSEDNILNQSDKYCEFVYNLIK